MIRDKAQSKIDNKTIINRKNSFRHYKQVNSTRELKPHAQDELKETRDQIYRNMKNNKYISGILLSQEKLEWKLSHKERTKPLDTAQAIASQKSSSCFK